MADSHIITGLLAKHTELAGLIQYHRNEITRIAAELNHLDATLKLFAPEFDLRTLGAKRVHKLGMRGFKFFKVGESHRLILDILREADQSLLTSEITTQMIAKKGLDETREVRTSLMRTITGSLRRLEARGMLQSADCGKGRILLWSLA